MKIWTSEEGKVGLLGAVNIVSAALGPWATTVEVVGKGLLLIGQVLVAWLTAWYIYTKIRKSNKTDEPED